MRHPRELPGSTPRVAANVNSNVQSVNNSSMNSSVHVDIKNAREEPEVATPTLAPKEEDKPEEPVRRAPLVETSAVADWQVVVVRQRHRREAVAVPARKGATRRRRGSCRRRRAPAVVLAVRARGMAGNQARKRQQVELCKRWFDKRIVNCNAFSECLKR